MCECFGEKCIGVSPHLLTSGDVTGSAGPTFQEVPEACEVDLAHDPKAKPAEQVARDGPVWKGREEGCALCAGWHLVAVRGHQYVYVYMYTHTHMFAHIYVYV